MSELLACIHRLAMTQTNGTRASSRDCAFAWRSVVSAMEPLQEDVHITEEHRNLLISQLVSALNDVSESVRASAVVAAELLLRRRVVTVLNCVTLWTDSVSLVRALLKNFNPVSDDEERRVLVVKTVGLLLGEFRGLYAGGNMEPVSDGSNFEIICLLLRETLQLADRICGDPCADVRVAACALVQTCHQLASHFRVHGATGLSVESSMCVELLGKLLEDRIFKVRLAALDLIVANVECFCSAECHDFMKGPFTLLVSDPRVEIPRKLANEVSKFASRLEPNSSDHLCTQEYLWILFTLAGDSDKETSERASCSLKKVIALARNQQQGQENNLKDGDRAECVEARLYERAFSEAISKCVEWSLSLVLHPQWQDRRRTAATTVLLEISVKCFECGVSDASERVKDSWVEFFVSLLCGDLQESSRITRYLHQLRPAHSEVLFQLTAVHLLQTLKSYQGAEHTQHLRTVEAHFSLLALSIPDNSSRSQSFVLYVQEFVQHLTVEVSAAILRASFTEVSKLIMTCAQFADCLLRRRDDSSRDTVLEPSSSLDEALLLFVVSLEGILQYTQIHAQHSTRRGAASDATNALAFRMIKECKECIAERNQLTSQRISELIDQVIKGHDTSATLGSTGVSEVKFQTSMKLFALKSLFGIQVVGGSVSSLPRLSAFVRVVSCEKDFHSGPKTALNGEKESSGLTAESRDPSELVGVVLFCTGLVTQLQDNLSALCQRRVTVNSREELMVSVADFIEFCLSEISAPLLAWRPSWSESALRNCALNLVQQSIELSTCLVQIIVPSMGRSSEATPGIVTRVKEISRDTTVHLAPHLKRAMEESFSPDCRALSLRIAYAFIVNYRAFTQGDQLDCSVRIVFEPLDVLCKAVANLLDDDEPDIRRMACQVLGESGCLPISEQTLTDVLLRLNIHSSDEYLHDVARPAIARVYEDNPHIVKNLSDKLRESCTAIESVVGRETGKECAS